MLLKTSLSYKKCLTFFLIFLSLSSSANLIIYQVYGSGGNSGAAYQDDYVVLYNNGGTPLNTGTNWSLQYESDTGSGPWDVFQLPDVTINSGAYYFIKVETSNSIGKPLTSFDTSTGSLGGAFGLALSGGKLAVFEHPGGIVTPYPGSDPTLVTVTGLLLTDMLGYGSANAFETAAAPDMNSNSTVLYRTGGDTGNNSTDFARNSNLSIGAFDVNYISFEGKAKTDAISLHWQTSTETNNQGFEVQKSRNAVNFETIARIDGAGDSNDINSYAFIDERPFPGPNYYRLEQKDFDGTNDFSIIIQVFYDVDASYVSVYPNPLSAGQDLNIQKSASLELKSIRNIMGQNFQAFSDLKEGLYFLHFKNSNGEKITKKLMVN